MKMSSNDPLLNKSPEKQVSGGRGWVKWYVLCMLSIESCLQNAVWAGWGPIAQSAKAVYQWEDSTVNLMVNLGNIGTMLFVIPCAYVLDVKGLRMSMLGGCFLQAVGNGLRIITTRPGPATWLIGTGQLLNGIGGTIAFAAPPLLSETWFAASHRATSTSISILFSSIGGAMAFVLGPALVTQPPRLERNANVATTFAIFFIRFLKTGLNSDLGDIRSQIMHLNYLYFGLTTALFLVVVVYFPNKPPQPPSITAGLKRYDFTKGFFRLIRHKWFWYIAFTFAVPAGVYGSWGSVLDVNLNPLGITQTEAGWFGFYGSLGGAIAGMIIGRFADIFMKRIKLFLVCLFSLSAVFFTWFTCLCMKFIPINTVSLYISCITGSVLVNSTIPLFFELACETSYPIAAGITSGCLSLALTLTGTVFLLISMIPDIGTLWSNWCLLGCVAATVPLLALFKDKYKRMDVDFAVTEERHVKDIN